MSYAEMAQLWHGLDEKGKDEWAREIRAFCESVPGRGAIPPQSLADLPVARQQPHK